MYVSVIGAQIDKAIREAEEEVRRMKGINFTRFDDIVRADLEVAEEYLDKIRNISQLGQVSYSYIFMHMNSFSIN